MPPVSSLAESSSSNRQWRLIRNLLLGGAMLIAAAFMIFHAGGGTAISPHLSAEPASGNIGCLGRIIPEDEVVRLAAPSYLGPSIVVETAIHDGDEVHAGQVLCRLDSEKRLEAAWHQAESRAVLAQRQLGLRSKEFERQKKLFASRAISASDFDLREMELGVASAELDAARAEVNRTRAEYELAMIRAPADGRILKVNAFPGESVGNDGIAEFARTGRMFVRAEVDEHDVRRLRVGEHATIRGDALDGELSGRVVFVGSEVQPNHLLSRDPAEFADARVIIARIELDDAAAAASAINARVEVVISPSK